MPTVQAPTVQATVQDFSARQTQEMGQATASLGAGLQRIAVQLQDDINETEAKDGDVKIGDVIDGLTYAEDGYFTKKGKDALGYNRQKLLDTVRNESMKIAGTMPNAMARRMYERSAQARIERLENQVLGYAFEQTQKAKQDATASRMLRLSRDQIAYADSWKMPGSAFQKTRAVWEGEFSELLKQQSIAPDSDKAAVLREDALTPVHSEIVTKLIDQGKVDQAREYLDAVTLRAVDQQDPQTGAVRKGARELTPEAETNLRKSLRVGETKDAAQRYALQLGRDAALPTLEDKIRQADADFEANKMTVEVRDQVVDRLRAADVFRRDGQAQAANKALANFQRWASQPENRFKNASDWPDSSSISLLQDTGMWDNAISIKGRLAPQTNPDSYFEVDKISRTGGWSQPQFATPELARAYFSSNGRSLSNEHMMVMLAARENALNPQPQNVQVTSIISAEERFKLWARQPEVNILSADPEDDTPEQKAHYMQALDRFTTRLNLYERDVFKGKASSDQVKMVLTEMATDQARMQPNIPWWKFIGLQAYMGGIIEEARTPKPIALMTKEEASRAFVQVQYTPPGADIPQKARVALGDIDPLVISYYEQRLIRKQMPPTFDNVAKLWLSENKINRDQVPVDFIRERMSK